MAFESIAEHLVTNIEWHNFFDADIDRPSPRPGLSIDDATRIAKHERDLLKIAQRVGGAAAILISAAVALLARARGSDPEE